LDEIDVPTNSVATVVESGSEKSALMSLTKVECQSPVMSIRLLIRASARWSMMRWRATG
jgi:hypothetical protein